MKWRFVKINDDITYGAQANISYMSEFTPHPASKKEWLWISGCGVQFADASDKRNEVAITYVALTSSISSLLIEYG